MVVLDKTIDIRAPADRVWRFLTRLSLTPTWSPGIVRAVARDGATDVGPGVVFTTVREDLGIHFESEQEAVDATPPHRFAWRQLAGDFVRNDGAYELTPIDGSTTRVRLRVLLELPFVLPRMLRDDDIRAHYSRRYDDALIQLKTRVERSPENL